MIYITGDCHGDIGKLIKLNNNVHMTKDDYVIICGDFGVIWNNKKDSISRERYLLDELDKLSFTTLFIDGNHEGFDRLHDMYPTVSFADSKATKITNSVYHLQRGNVYELQGKKFFTMGGASSQDIKDGIISKEKFARKKDYKSTIKLYSELGLSFRIKNVDWWENELPSDSELLNGLVNLSKLGNKVDYIITHCLPTNYLPLVVTGRIVTDKLTNYLQKLKDGELFYKEWFCGHYHINATLPDKITILYNDFVRIL